MKKKKQNVKQTIFRTNTSMILGIFGLCVLVNAMVIKLYSEWIESQLHNSVLSLHGETQLKQFLEQWTIGHSGFYLVFFLDAFFCLLLFLLVNRWFTKRLSQQIMLPLTYLSQATKAIENNDLSQTITYEGLEEFENLCTSFDTMRLALERSQKKSAAYEKARTDMMAGLSHDLRTPLTAIRGTLKALLDGVVSEKKQTEQFLERAYHRSEQMEGLLNQLMDLSTMEKETLPISMQRVSLFSLCKDYADQHQESVSMNVHTSGCTNVSIDPFYFTRILDNLVSNSQKYAQISPLRMDLSMEVVEGHVRLTVCDHGVGVSKEALPQLFESFYRADVSRNEKEGSGLGLYIVRFLVETMHGRVWAENKDGLTVCMEWPQEEERHG